MGKKVANENRANEMNEQIVKILDKHKESVVIKIL